MTRGLPRILRRLLDAQGGSILAESAMTLSILALISLAGVEIGRYMLLHQKIERVASSVGDLIAQAPTLSMTDAANVFAAIDEVARPFEMGPKGLVIISSVSLDAGGDPALNWQCSSGGLSGTSNVGQSGGAASLPSGLSVDAGDTLIVAEVRYQYTPFLYSALIGASQLYHTAFFRPRQGTLTQISGGCPP